MKIAIMQPYFLPYIGYFQLISAVDTFVVYDNIKFTKKGWINRNRILLNSADVLFSLPIKKDSDSLYVVQRELAIDFDRDKLLNKIKGAYSCAPQFEESYPLIESIIRYKDTNLFRYIYNSILQLVAHIGLKTEIKISSDILIDHSLKGQDKVVALCKQFVADAYINPIGGIELYDAKVFERSGLKLNFLKTKPIEYKQFNSSFIAGLSIVDVLMFNDVKRIQNFLGEYDLVTRIKKDVNQNE